jgi:hypothetical protein
MVAYTRTGQTVCSSAYVKQGRLIKHLQGTEHRVPQDVIAVPIGVSTKENVHAWLEYVHLVHHDLPYHPEVPHEHEA